MFTIIMDQMSNVKDNVAQLSVNTYQVNSKVLMLYFQFVLVPPSGPKISLFCFNVKSIFLTRAVVDHT